MGKFLSELNVHQVDSDNGGKWELTTPFVYYSETTNDTYTVPIGFVTDFASVPRIPGAYYLAGNTAHKAAVVHDFLCRTKLVSRLMADEVFLEAMKDQQVPAWRRWLMFLGVRIGSLF